MSYKIWINRKKNKMGIIDLGVIAITSIHTSYASLPDTAYSYDGETRDISQFYDQKIPNMQFSGYATTDNGWFDWMIDTGIHTEKLNTVALQLGYNHNYKIDDNQTITFGLSQSLSLAKHSACTDDYNREYYCGNLTAWSDFENKRTHNADTEISINYNITW